MVPDHEDGRSEGRSQRLARRQEGRPDENVQEGYLLLGSQGYIKGKGTRGAPATKRALIQREIGKRLFGMTSLAVRKTNNYQQDWAQRKNKRSAHPLTRYFPWESVAQGDLEERNGGVCAAEPSFPRFIY